VKASGHSGCALPAVADWDDGEIDSPSIEKLVTAPE
jgi:hypothetical protein